MTALCLDGVSRFRDFIRVSFSELTRWFLSCLDSSFHFDVVTYLVS